MKRFGIVAIVLASTLVAGGAWAYTIGTPYTTPDWYAGDGAAVSNGTINTTGFTFGTFISGNAYQFGNSGANVGWDDNWVPGGPSTSGDFLDGYWAQVYSAVTGDGVWDLGSAFSRVAVFSAQDHGPYLGEGLEYFIYGSNDQVNWSVDRATLTNVYVDGWRVNAPGEDINGNGWNGDDVSAILSFDQSYRYIKLVAAGPNGSGLEEPEIDAVAGAPVPEPSTMLLLGSGLVGLVGYGRRRLKK